MYFVDGGKSTDGHLFVAIGGEWSAQLHAASLQETRCKEAGGKVQDARGANKVRSVSEMHRHMQTDGGGNKHHENQLHQVDRNLNNCG